ncbi:MarR family winged helix-turn-helix transcriptional regulator [Xanthobacter sp.]|uniref:MarR family winged helix-turn-helix transcriptional regulator n=1 Tax=Xanthobacter sp. TaxID=35809 RepID=UPI0035AED942
MHAFMDTPCHCARLRRATRRISAIYDEGFAPFGINVAQYSLLRSVRDKSEVSMTELGRMLELDRSTVGRNVRVLSKHGLVEMRRGKDDQREACIALTPQGTELLKSAAEAWRRSQKTIEDRLGKDRLEQLRDLLAAL